MGIPHFPANGGIALRGIALCQYRQLFEGGGLARKIQFIGFGNLVHDEVVILLFAPTFFHVVCFENFLTYFLNRQFRLINCYEKYELRQHYA